MSSWAKPDGVPNLLGCAHVGWGKDLALRLDGDLVTRADPLVSWPKGKGQMNIAKTPKKKTCRILDDNSGLLSYPREELPPASHHF